MCIDYRRMPDVTGCARPLVEIAQEEPESQDSEDPLGYDSTTKWMGPAGFEPALNPL